MITVTIMIGLKCTETYAYNPIEDYCFTDFANDGKYCWYSDPMYVPVGEWGKVTGKGYDDCGSEYTEVRVVDA